VVFQWYFTEAWAARLEEDLRPLNIEIIYDSAAAVCVCVFVELVK